MKKPENFIPSKLKLPKAGGLVVHYTEKTTVKGITDTKDLKITDSVNAHPELIEKIEQLKPFLAECYGMNAFLTLSKSKGLDKAQKDAFKSVSTVVKNVHATQMDKLSITGLSMRGLVENEKDGRSVVITGTMEQENKTKTAINSPSIKLAQDKFKFESDLQDVVNDLIEELEKYLFEGKKAQLEIAFEEKKEADLEVA